jgi:hypothetical protein
MTQMNYLVSRVFNWVYKIPFSLGAFHELGREKQNLGLAQKDEFFSQHVPVYKVVGGVLKVKYMDHINTSPRHLALINKYFSQAFKDYHLWQNIPIEELIDSELLSRTLDAEVFSTFASILTLISVPLSSAHGDFHSGNIFVNDGSIYIIDWPNYNKKSSRYFDLIQYYIMVNGYLTWFEGIKALLNDKDQVLELNGVKVSKQIIFAYGVWQLASDIELIISYGWVTEKKRMKYNEIALFISLNVPQVRL